MVRDIVTELLLVVPFYILHFAKNRVNHEALYKVWSRRDGVSFSGLAPHAAATTSHCTLMFFDRGCVLREYCISVARHKVKMRLSE